MVEYNEVNYWGGRSRPNSSKSIAPVFSNYIAESIKDCIDLLEFGPGVGRMFELYQDREEVHCFDIHRSYFKECKKEAKKYGFKISFTVCPEIGFTLFNDKEFDVVVCSQVLLHQKHESIAKVMKELARIGKKVVCISLKYDPNGPELRPHCFFHDYKDICSQNGWHYYNEVLTKSNVCFTYEED